MSTSNTRSTYRKGLYDLWRGIPDAIRSPIRLLLASVHLQSSVQRLLGVEATSNTFMTMTPETPPALSKSIEHIAHNNITGDYYEFGMFRGYTFWHTQQTATSMGIKGMRFFGFDSFEGLPEPKDIDAKSNEFKKGDYACSEEQVRNSLNTHGVDWSKTYLIKGYYEQSLKQSLKSDLQMGSAAIVLIDCDLYHSTVPVLTFIADMLQDGSVILFDDWNCFNKSNTMGERRAFHEFLQAHPEWIAEPFVSFGWHGEAFIMRRQLA